MSWFKKRGQNIQRHALLTVIGLWYTIPTHLDVTTQLGVTCNGCSINILVDGQQGGRAESDSSAPCREGLAQRPAGRHENGYRSPL
jgi:hypothetical protein